MRSTVPAALLLLLAAMVLAPAPAAAQAKKVGTVTVPGVNGGAPIAIVAYDLGVEVPPASGGGGAGVSKPDFSEFRVVKPVDATSSALLQVLTGGTLLPAVQIDLPLGGRGASATYVLNDAKIVATTRRPADKGSPPLETLAFSFGRFTETLTTAAGSTVTCWDTALGQACP
jgi:type VI protein secretion system component Hcp